MAKIVPTPYPEDMEVGVDEISVTYIQTADTNDDSDHYQYLKLTSVSACGGNDEDLPYYVNLSIPNFDDGTPGHWSLDLSENITDILEDFKERLANKKTNNEEK